MSSRQLARYRCGKVTAASATKIIIRYLGGQGWDEEVRLPEWVESLGLEGCSFVDVNCARYFHELGTFSWEVSSSLARLPPECWRSSIERGRHVEQWLICREGSVA